MTPEEKASQTEFIRQLVETAPPSSPELKALLRQLLPPVTGLPRARRIRADMTQR